MGNDEQIGVVLALLGLLTVLQPMPKPVELPVNPTMDMTVSRRTNVLSGVVVALTPALDAICWQRG